MDVYGALADTPEGRARAKTWFSSTRTPKRPTGLRPGFLQFLNSRESNDEYIKRTPVLYRYAKHIEGNGPVLALANLEATTAFGAVQKLTFHQSGLPLGHSSVLAVLSAKARIDTKHC